MPLCKNRFLCTFSFACIALSGCAASASQSSSVLINLNGTVFEKAGQEFNIAPALLYSVALCESAYSPQPGSQTVAPYPWVLRTPAAPFYGEDKAEAVKELKRILEISREVDVGLMQINIRWHGHRVSDPTDLLEPLTNVRTGAQILDELLNRYPSDALKAIGRYHSSNEERAQKYGRIVWRIYSQLKSK